MAAALTLLGRVVKTWAGYLKHMTYLWNVEAHLWQGWRGVFAFLCRLLCVCVWVRVGVFGCGSVRRQSPPRHRCTAV